MFTFPFLNNKIDQKTNFAKLPITKWLFFGITVNFIIQKLKIKHLVSLSFLWWHVFFEGMSENILHIPGLNSLCHIIHFLANFYFIFEISHAKTLMKYARCLYNILSHVLTNDVHTFLWIYQFLSILWNSSSLQKPEIEIFVFYNIDFD